MILDRHQSFRSGPIRFGWVQIPKISPEKSHIDLTKNDLDTSKMNWT